MPGYRKTKNVNAGKMGMSMGGPNMPVPKDAQMPMPHKAGGKDGGMMARLVAGLKKMRASKKGGM